MGTTSSDSTDTAAQTASAHRLFISITMTAVNAPAMAGSASSKVGITEIKAKRATDSADKTALRAIFEVCFNFNTPIMSAAGNEIAAEAFTATVRTDKT